MIGTLQDLEHHTRTAYGTSESFMHNDSSVPFQGIFQGNRASSTIWVAISTPIIKIVRGSWHGIKFESLLSHDNYRLVVLSFVGDTDIVEGDLTRTKITIEDVYIIM